MNAFPTAAAAACLLAISTANAAPRDVQIRSVDITAGVLELHNFGASTETLAGWRFCSHDESELRRYSASAGLNAVSLPPAGSLFIHFNNDSPPSTTDNRLDILEIGGNFALPIDNGPYAIQLYWPNGGSLSFGQPSDVVDHLQWSINGADDTIADERSDEAEAAGLWTDQTTWIATATTTTYLRLNDTSGGLLHSPASYDALDAFPDCQPNGIDDFFDIADGTSDDADMDGIPDECNTPAACLGDADGNNSVDVNDITFVVNALGTTPGPCAAGDVDGNGVVDVNDITTVVNNLGECRTDPACN